MSAVPTGAATPIVGKRSASPKGSKKKQTPFQATSSRALQLEIMGEETPGPGSYLPASTFGKFASKSNKQFAKQPSPEFRSKSPQRARAKNPEFPGPGAHSPNKAAIERNRTNAANGLKSHAIRFRKDEMGGDGTAHVGPGEYESHVVNTTQQIVAKQVGQMSRQNPGFGIAGPAHKLPHEQPVEDDKELPGPGKYETNVSEIEKVNGHSSSFKQPIEKPKLRGAGAMDLPDTGKKKGKGGGKKAPPTETKKL